MSKKKTESGRRVRPTLSGYHLFAYERFRDAQGKTDTEAMALIMQTWIKGEDRALLEALGISLENFEKAIGNNIRRGSFNVDQGREG
jgi:hypothetical protein